MAKQIRILYLSHGLNETGGYRHEKCFTETIADTLLNCSDCYEEKRFRKNYQGIFAWINLFFQSFFAAKGDVIITVARLAWPVYFRNFLNKSKIIVVLHNMDEKDGKPWYYFYILRKFLFSAFFRSKKIAIVTVAPFWEQQLKKAFKLTDNLFLFPNLFSNANLRFYADVVNKKSNLIHLGQWSEKADKKQYLLLLSALKEKGLVAYFSDNSGAVVHDFPVSYFATSEAYLKQMALSSFTVIMNKVNEGWPRLVHESFLVGTQVIAIGGGGLVDVVSAGNGFMADNVEDVIRIISENRPNEISFAELEKYDIATKNTWIYPIEKWLKKS